MRRLQFFLFSAVLVWTGCSGSQTSAPQQYLPQSRNVAASSTTEASQCSIDPTTGRGASGYAGAVAALSPDNAWGVGSTPSGPSSSPTSTIAISHYNGSSWSLVALPTIPGSSNWTGSRLNGVAALSATDAWAVGEETDHVSKLGVGPIILHWNGTTWAPVSVPALANAAASAVAADASNDVWIAGDSANVLELAHWNGSTWSAVPIPPNNGIDGVEGMIALSRSDVRILSFTQSLGSEAIYEAGVFEWNGSTVRLQIMPQLGTQRAYFPWGISATSSNDIWVAGTVVSGNAPYFAHHANTSAGDAGWSSYESTGVPVQRDFPGGIVDFRTGYAVTIEQQSGLLLWNGRDRWHTVPVDIPPLSAPIARYFGAFRVPNTTTFWTLVSSASGSGSTELVRCAANPLY